MASTGPWIEIVVDELVLRGVPPERAGATVAAFEAGLVARGETRARFGEPLSAHTDAPHRAPAVAVAAGADALGDGMAGAVWNAITGGPR
jgi:hypothetical protein